MRRDYVSIGDIMQLSRPQGLAVEFGDPVHVATRGQGQEADNPHNCACLRELLSVLGCGVVRAQVRV